MSGFAAWISREGVPVRAETWPVVRADGRLALAADLRLDNRAELCAALGLDERAAADAEILLAAYERWGEDCPRHLVGDFAFVLWDGRQRRLLGARDPMGVCPLYYTRAGGGLVAASTIEAVLTSLPSPAEINEPFLRDLAASRLDRWVEETPYRGVLRLPPGHRMVLEGERLRLARYWTLGTESGPPLRSDEEYLARFREIFLDAVGSRMRGSGPIGFLVSGGMDSSAIACAAHHLVETGVLPAETDLRFYSAVFADTPGAEEREYAEAVARRCPRARMTYVPADDCWGLSDFATDGGYPLAEPEIGISRAVVLRLLRQARQDGCRIVLTGIGGDQVLGGEPYHRPGGLRDVERRRLLAEIPHFRRSSRRSTAGLVAEAWLRPAVPAPLRRAVRRLRSGPSLAVAPERRPAEPPPPFPTLAARESFRYLTEGSFSARLAGLRIASDHVGVETRLPFLDRRLIDFMLTVPARLRFRNGWIKWVLRQSLEGILAEEVRQRTRLAWFSALAHRGLRERARARVLDLLAGSRLVQVGLASEDTLWQDWNNYWSGKARFAPPQTLIGFLCAESWLRAREPLSLAPAPGMDGYERSELFA